MENYIPEGEQHQRGNDSLLWNSRFPLIHACKAYKVGNKGVGSSCDSRVGYANEFQVLQASWTKTQGRTGKKGYPDFD